jgi:hypothetical protein
MIIQARPHGVASREELRRIQDDEDRSIGTAMRATFWFVAIVLLLLWAGVSDAAPASPAPATHFARSG